MPAPTAPPRGSIEATVRGELALPIDARPDASSSGGAIERNATGAMLVVRCPDACAARVDGASVRDAEPARVEGSATITQRMRSCAPVPALFALLSRGAGCGTPVCVAVYTVDGDGVAPLARRPAAGC